MPNFIILGQGVEGETHTHTQTNFFIDCESYVKPAAWAEIFKSP